MKMVNSVARGFRRKGGPEGVVSRHFTSRHLAMPARTRVFQGFARPERRRRWPVRTPPC